MVKGMPLIQEIKNEVARERINRQAEIIKQDRCELAWNPPAVVLRGANPRMNNNQAIGWRYRIEIITRMLVPNKYVKINSRPKPIAAALWPFPAPEETIDFANLCDKCLITSITPLHPFSNKLGGK